MVIGGPIGKSVIYPEHYKFLCNFIGYPDIALKFIKVKIKTEHYKGF